MLCHLKTKCFSFVCKSVTFPEAINIPSKKSIQFGSLYDFCTALSRLQITAVLLRLDSL